MSQIDYVLYFDFDFTIWLSSDQPKTVYGRKQP
jgi:hypothetical protein